MAKLLITLYNFFYYLFVASDKNFDHKYTAQWQPIIEIQDSKPTSIL